MDLHDAQTLASPRYDAGFQIRHLSKSSCASILCSALSRRASVVYDLFL
jgi:hypothetical protein